MRNTDHGGFFHGRVTHQRVFKIHGTDPFATGLDQVLAAIDELDETVLVDVGHVTRAQPAVGRPSMRLLGHIVVRRRDPRAAHFQLANSHAVVRRLRAVGLDHAGFHKRRRNSLFKPLRVYVVFAPGLHVRTQQRTRGVRRGFRHAPQARHPESMPVESAHQRLGRRGSPDQHAHRPRKFPPSSLVFECIENSEPDRRHSEHYRDALLLHQVENAFRIRKGPRQDELRPGQRGGERNPPAVHMKHGRHWQYRIPK